MPLAGAPILVGDNARYRIKAVQNTVQALAASTFTAIAFDGADEVDDLGVHDPVTNNSRLNLGLAIGYWLISAVCALPSGTGERRMRLVTGLGAGLNGGYRAKPNVTTTGGFDTVESTTMWQTTASTDYLTVHGFSSVAGNTVVSGDLRSAVTALYLGA